MEAAAALEFIRHNNRAVMLTTRADGRPAMSPVVVAVIDDQVMISTRQTAYKIGHVRRHPEASLCILPDSFFGRWIQVNGRAVVIDLPEAMDLLVAHYRMLSGEHPDWDDYRRAMVEDRRCIVRFEILSAGPDVAG
jgi:PPOX class probable F420-dependent enzyme